MGRGPVTGTDAVVLAFVASHDHHVSAEVGLELEELGPARLRLDFDPVGPCRAVIGGGPQAQVVTARRQEPSESVPGVL